MFNYTSFSTDSEEIVINILDTQVWIEFREILEDNYIFIIDDEVLIFKELLNFVNDYIDRKVNKPLNKDLLLIFDYLKDNSEELAEDLRDTLVSARLFYYKNISDYDENKH